MIVVNLIFFKWEGNFMNVNNNHFQDANWMYTSPNLFQDEVQTMDVCSDQEDMDVCLNSNALQTQDMSPIQQQFNKTKQLADYGSIKAQYDLAHCYERGVVPM